MPPQAAEPSIRSGVLRLRVATPGDAAATARLHAAHLDHGFLPRLGPGFLRAWHRSVISSQYGLSYVVVTDDDDVVGFLMGSSDQHRLMADLLRRRRSALLAAGVLGLLCRPGMALTFLRTRLTRYARRLSSSPSPARAAAPGAAVAVVSAVVVAPEFGRRGAGAALLAAFTRAAHFAGAGSARLVTLAGPAGAGAFYRAQGWSRLDGHPDANGVFVETYEVRLTPPLRSAMPGTHASARAGTSA